MVWYAIESLQDALDATQELLTPLDVRQWLKLAIVVFFVGTGSGGAGTPFNFPGGGGGPSTGGPTTGGPTTGGDLPMAAGDALLLVAAVVAAVVLIGLVFGAIATVMEFVFVESISRQEVQIRASASDHLGQGLRLFGFRLVLGLLVLLPVAAMILAVFPALGGDVALSLGVIVLLLPILLLVALVVAVVDGFTRNFVVPVMLVRESGVLDGWRAFWPTLRAEWKQYGVYVLVRFVLGLVVGVIGTIVGGIVGVIAFVPTAILGFFAVSSAGAMETLFTNPLLLGGLVVGGLLYLLVVGFVVAVAFVPVQAYLRYFALLVLGDTEAEFDLIPDLRETVRAE